MYEICMQMFWHGMYVCVCMWVQVVLCCRAARVSSEDLEGDLQDLEAKENELDNLIEQAGVKLILFYFQSIEN